MNEKLSLRRTFSNTIFAMKLCYSISKEMVVYSFFLWLFGYAEWVFFDGIFMRKIVDDLSAGRPVRNILTFIIASGAVFCAIAIYSSYVENVVYPLQTNRLFGGIYKLLYSKAKNVELRCYEDSDFYNRYTMAMDGAEEKITAIIRGILGTVIGAVSSAIVFGMMYEIDHYAMLFIISPLLGNFLFGNLKNKYELKRYREQAPNEKVLNYVSRMMYLPDGAKEIRLSNVFSLFKQQYNEATDENVRIARKYAFSNASLNFWRITFTFTVIFEGVLLYAIYLNRVKGSISLAELTIMTSLMVAMTWILIRVFENIMEVMKNAMFINNLRGFLEYEETIPEDSDGLMPSKEFESLEFRNVSFTYDDSAAAAVKSLAEDIDNPGAAQGSGTAADSNKSMTESKAKMTVRNLSFTIKKGENAALVGHNGAGKTTIIKLLLRLYDPTEGAIYYNGRDIREYNLKAYREIFAATFQDYQMFGMSVKENVLMGRHYDDEDERVAQALRKSGVYDKVMSLPKGIDTIMTKEFDADGAVLSGGETQKIAVARTFAKNAPMKIFDEPSSALDPIAEYELFGNIIREGVDHTMLFISHRLSSVKNCDKVLMLESGTLIEEGTHESLMAKNGKYASMYKKQAMNYLAIEDESEVIR